MTVTATQSKRSAAVKQTTQAPAFTSGVGKAVKLGGVAMKEAKLTPAAKKATDDLAKLSETGDGPGFNAWKMSRADAAALLKSPAKMKAVLFEAITGEKKGDDGYDDFFAGGKSTELKLVDRKGGFAGLARVFVNAEDDTAKGTDERKQLDAALRAALPTFMGDADTKLIRITQHDNGYGYYWGLAALNAKTGELKLAQNVNAP